MAEHGLLGRHEDGEVVSSYAGHFGLNAQVVEQEDPYYDALRGAAPLGYRIGFDEAVQRPVAEVIGVAAGFKQGNHLIPEGGCFFARFFQGRPESRDILLGHSYVLVKASILRRGGRQHLDGNVEKMETLLFGSFSNFHVGRGGKRGFRLFKEVPQVFHGLFPEGCAHIGFCRGHWQFQGLGRGSLGRDRDALRLRPDGGLFGFVYRKRLPFLCVGYQAQQPDQEE